jgi:hypothetical protein
VRGPIAAHAAVSVALAGRSCLARAGPLMSSGRPGASPAATAKGALQPAAPVQGPSGRRQPSRGKPVAVVFSDIDGTLVHYENSQSRWGRAEAEGPGPALTWRAADGSLHRLLRLPPGATGAVVSSAGWG